MEFPILDITGTLPPNPLANVIKMYEEHSKFYIVLLGDNGDPSFISKMKNSIKPKLKVMLIEKGVADDFDLDYTLEYTLSAMIGILSYWFAQENTPPTARLLNLIVDIMNNGVMHKLA